jgi:uncharacterized protein YceK
MRSLAFILFIGALFISNGCCSTVNLLSHKEPFGGIRSNLRFIKSAADVPTFAVIATIDAPASLAVDTAALPFLLATGHTHMSNDRPSGRIFD